MKTTKQALNSAEAAEYLGLSEPTLRSWRSRGTGDLKYTKIGGRVVYRRADLDKYIREHSRTSTEKKG